MRQPGGIFYSVKIIMILALVGAGFFCGEKVGLANQEEILINEIMYDAVGSDTDNEWIEIYNAGSGAVTMVEGSGTGSWRFNDGSNHILTLVQGSLTIVPGGFAIIASNGAKFLTDHQGYSGTVIDTVMSLNNTSDTLKLSSDKGLTFFGEITYQSSWGGNGNGKTLEKQSASWAESLAVGGTPGAANSAPVVEPPAITPPPADSAATSTPMQTADETASSTEENTNPPNPLYQGGVKINFGDVLINELVSDPADNEVEWIELYNRLNKEIDLSGWRLEDGSKAKTDLSGAIGASGSERFKIIEKPNGNLNNAGDLIALLDGSEKIIDQLVYGGWDDGNPADNAPAAPDPNSLARKFDGYNSYNNFNDFAVTLKPTKGAANIIQTEDEVSLEARAKYDYSEDILITEIMPNPLGDDGKLEFIEIHNAGVRAVDLSGWSLSNEDGQKKNLENLATSTKIQAGEYLAVFRPRSKIVLHNDSGEARLYQPLADKPARIVKYKDVKEGWSYDVETPKTSPQPSPWQGEGDWEWSETPTPGAANLFKPVNQAPAADFSFTSPALVNVPVNFDSSDTVDADGDQLSFLWDFGDGFKNNLANPEHTYLKVGVYKVKLEVDDGKAVGKKEKSVKVVATTTPPLNLPLSKGEDQTEIPLSFLMPVGVILNEVFPNPAGADTGQEWIELLNQSPVEINLLNWRLENENGKYEFKSEELVAAGEFYVLNNAISKLAFKNSADVINLYNDLDELADTVEYAEAVEGEAYARGVNGGWFWTTSVTPGAVNVISVADSQSGIMNNESRIMGNANVYVETDLEKVRELEIGSLVKIKGTVAVEPGILGAQIFYIVGSPGLQIYNYQKDFPALKVGDYIEVAGELALAQGELRIKTKDKTDIKINEHKLPPTALAMSADAVSEDYAAQLITVSGEITDKKSSTLYLDDGNNEILIYIKKNTGISTKGLTVGQTVAITGILSKTNSGLRLMPRYQSDIAAVAAAGALEPQVLGEVAAASEWEVAARDKKMELFKYLLIIAAGVIVVLAGLFVKARRQAN